jgi:branched-chain amino acid transport system permease protein
VSDITAEVQEVRGRSVIGGIARYTAMLLLAAFLIAIPFYVNNYIQFVVNTIVVYCLVAVGFNIVVGYLGQLAFANAAFFGIGAYAAGLLAIHFNVPFVLCLCAAAFAGASAGAIVGIVALRLSGYYLVVTTFAFIEFMRWAYIHGGKVTFGSSGFNVPEATIAGAVLDNDAKKYFVFLGITVAAVWATSRLLRSRFGRAIVAVRNNERAAAADGIPVIRTKVIAFMWSGLIVGLAGALYAILNGRITPDSFGLDQMLTHFVIVMVGGLGSLTGSILGAVLLTSLPEFLRNFTGIEEIVYSILLIFVIFFMPKGLGGLVVWLWPSLREPLYRGNLDA